MDVQLVTTAAIALESATLGSMQRPTAQAAQPLPMRPPAAAPVASDVASAFVAEGAAPAEIAQVAALLQPQQPPEVATRIAALSNDTALALQVGDHARALSNISQVATLDPHAVEPLRTDPVLDPIRPEVEQFVNRLTTVAKMNAEGWLSQADDVLASPVPAPSPNVSGTLNLPPQSPVPALDPETVMKLLASSYVQGIPQTPAQAAQGLTLQVLALQSQPVAQQTLQPTAQPLSMQPSVVQPLVPSQSAPQTVARIAELTQDTALALHQGDRTRALANVTQIATLQPQAVEALRTNTAFTSLRPEVDRLLTQLPAAVKATLNAPALPAASSSTPALPDRIALLASLIKPETLLHVAHRLFDAGGYANYVRSADLAQAVVNPLTYSPFLEQWAAALAPKALPGSAPIEEDELLSKTRKLATAEQTLAAIRDSATPRIKTLWRRAPLLVMLLTWLGAGVIAGSASVILKAMWPDTVPASLIEFGFNVWATGFLLLVCLGFYARIRTIRMRPANLG